MTKMGDYGLNYYLIPNGSGDWRKTDPRRDRARLISINQACGGKVLNVIRALKYWNQHQYQRRISSYLLETMISDYYDIQVRLYRTLNISGSVDLEIIKVLKYLADNISYAVKDPKLISNDINYLSYDQRLAMRSKFNGALDMANLARRYELEGKTKESIKKWRDFFGDDFPDYTG